MIALRWVFCTLHSWLKFYFLFGLVLNISNSSKKHKHDQFVQIFPVWNCPKFELIAFVERKLPNICSDMKLIFLPDIILFVSENMLWSHRRGRGFHQRRNRQNVEGVRRVMVLLGSKEGGGSMSQQKVLSESRFILSLCLLRIVYTAVLLH